MDPPKGSPQAVPVYYQPPPGRAFEQQAAYPPPQGWPPQAAAPPPSYYTPPPQYYVPPPPLHQQPQHPKPPGYDAEALAAADQAAGFASAAVRDGFVRKVFALVLLQLVVTVGIACVFMFVKPLKRYVASSEGNWVFYLAWALSFVMLIALSCSTQLRKRHPWNVVALGAFTLVMSVLVGSICAYWDVQVVLTAFAVTCGIVAALTVLALFMPWDFTRCGRTLAAASLVVFVVLLISLLFGFFYVSCWWYALLSGIIGLLFAAFLVFHIQLIVGGKKTGAAISPDDYVFASVQIYMDVVLIFLAVLAVTGVASR